MELSELLPGLYTASFRGIEFYMPDSRHEVGRRVQRFLFPGRDDTIDEDLGAHDGPIRITGLILGDDYIAQGRSIERAFRTAGPGTLSHPWLGELEVVLAEPASITFDDRKMRSVSFEAAFHIWRERQPPATDTLSRVIDGISELRGQAKSLLRQALNPLRMPIAAIGYVGSFATSAVSTWRSILLVGPAASAMAESTGSALAGLAALANIPVRTTLPDDVSTGLQAVPLAVAATGAVAPAPAIGSAATTAPTPPVDAAVAASLLLDGATAFARPAGMPSPAPELALAARAEALAGAVDVGSAITFDDASQARRWQARVDAAIGAAAGDAAAVAASLPLAAGPVWRSLGALRRAVAADMAVRIGRLPEVAIINVPAAAPAWLVAQHVAGDTPGRVQATMMEIIRRNALRTPALVPPGPLEILRPALPASVTLDPPAAPAELIAAGGVALLDAFILDRDVLG